MRFSLPTALTAALSLASVSNGIKILMNNDDGFGSGNIRELYKLLVSAGHDGPWTPSHHRYSKIEPAKLMSILVLIVAPAIQQSGQGGRSDFTTFPNLTTPSQYNIIPAGAPSIGTDPNDSNIWYYNGTPAACTFVALDYVLPRYYPEWDGSPDLLLAGPNFGTNLGPFVYSLSGTLGATYAAVSRSISGIALSASNPSIAYMNVTNSSNPATWAAKASFAVVEQFINNTGEDQRVLPLGYGVNVNIPELTDDTLPTVVKSRLTGEANTDVAVYNEIDGTFTWANLEPVAAGVNACYNGNCSLPGETSVVANGSISVSVFTIDYDAPSIPYTDMVFAKVDALFGDGGNGTTGYAKRRVNRETPTRMMTGRDVYREETVTN